MAKQAIDEMTERIKKQVQDLKASPEYQKNPATALDKFADNIDQTNKDSKKATQAIPNTRVYHIITIGLGIIALSTVVGAIVIAVLGKTLPDALLTVGGAAVGGLAGALVPQMTSGSSNGGTQ